MGKNLKLCTQNTVLWNSFFYVKKKKSLPFSGQLGFPLTNQLGPPGHYVAFSGSVARFLFGASDGSLPPDHIPWWHQKLWRAGAEGRDLSEGLVPLPFLCWALESFWSLPHPKTTIVGWVIWKQRKIWWTVNSRIEQQHQKSQMKPLPYVVFPKIHLLEDISNKTVVRRGIAFPSPLASFFPLTLKCPY